MYRRKGHRAERTMMKSRKDRKRNKRMKLRMARHEDALAELAKTNRGTKGYKAPGSQNPHKG